jgi:heme exporter protein D
MNWPDLSMGGYGFYVWGSYLFALVAIVWEVISLKQRRKSLGGQNDKLSNASVVKGSPNETTS